MKKPELLEGSFDLSKYIELPLESNAGKWH